MLTPSLKKKVFATVVNGTQQLRVPCCPLWEDALKSCAIEHLNQVLYAERKIKNQAERPNGKTEQRRNAPFAVCFSSTAVCMNHTIFVNF